jgi:LAO/AO transport system kinase
MSEQPQVLNRVQIARLISALERGESPASNLAPTLPTQTRVIGITGVPGAGKSTLVDALVAHYRRTSNQVAVIAVDPSSPLSSGAVLGDRIRMSRHSSDAGVFIRSMGSRRRTDGLGPAVQDSCRLLASAGYDPIFIETVGVGQVELGVVECCDIRVLVLAPAWGDYVQAAKAGLIEMVDVAVVNKSDLPGAETLIQELRETVRGRSDTQPIRVVGAIAAHAETGVLDVSAAMDEAWMTMQGEGLQQRRLQAVALELMSRVNSTFAGGPVQSLVTDGSVKRLAEAVCNGRQSAGSASIALYDQALARGHEKGA